MPIYIHLATSLLILCMLAGCSASKPDNDNVAATLTNEFGEAIEVGKIEQIDGIAYPGGAGAPESYELEFKATLIAPGPVTLRLSRDLGKQTRVKTIVAGHEPDPVGMAVFLDAMTHLWRTDETRPAVVTGSIRFVKAESGWRAGTMTVFLTDELMQAGSMPPRPRFERVAEGIRDNEQNLIWTETDIGNVNWEEAGKYCRSLGSGWNLPTAAQLESLYEHRGKTFDSGVSVGNWSVESDGSSTALFVIIGQRHSVPVDHRPGTGTRAACVRSP